MREVSKTLVKQADSCDKELGFGVAPITNHFGRLLANRNWPVFLRHRDAKRPAKIGVFVQCRVADSFRRVVPDSALLQPTVLAAVVGTYSPTDPQLERLSSGRSDFDLSLHFDCRTSTVSKTEMLQYNGLFLFLVGLKQFPDPTALRRYLGRLSPKAIRQLARLHDQLRWQLFNLPQARTRLTFHLDSVVLTLYGKQQGARLGYNPKKKGRPSYHPLLCFEAHGQEFWHGSLRPGDAATNTGARALVTRCLQKAPSTIARSRIRLLADSGFFSGRLVEDLDQAGCGYMIVCSKAKSYLPMAEGAGFKELSFGWAVAEFRFKPQRWTAEHRFIMVRRPVPEDPQEAEQLTLLRQGRYSYSCLPTWTCSPGWCGRLIADAPTWNGPSGNC